MKRVILFAALWTFAACSGGNILGIGKTEHEIKYTVSGEATYIEIVFTDENGNTKTEKVEKLPWRKNIKRKSGDWVYLRAKLNDSNGRMSLQVAKDGKALFFARGQSKDAEVYIQGQI